MFDVFDTFPVSLSPLSMIYSPHLLLVVQPLLLLDDDDWIDVSSGLACLCPHHDRIIPRCIRHSLLKCCWFQSRSNHPQISRSSRANLISGQAVDALPESIQDKIRSMPVPLTNRCFLSTLHSSSMPSTLTRIRVLAFQLIPPGLILSHLSQIVSCRTERV